MAEDKKAAPTEKAEKAAPKGEFDGMTVEQLKALVLKERAATHEAEARLLASELPRVRDIQAQPKPAKVTKGGIDLGPPGPWIAREGIAVSKKYGYGGQGSRLEFTTGEWLPESFPEECVAELLRQDPPAVWDSRKGRFQPHDYDVLRAPGIPREKIGTIVKRKGSDDTGASNVDAGSVGLPPA